MKLRKHFLTLFCSLAFLFVGIPNMQGSTSEEPAEDAALAAATELSLAPARASTEAITAKYGADSDEAKYAQSYLDLIETQGEWAFAFDFFTVSMLWTVVAAALVFIMHLGFATLEAGLTQSKNTVNILFKNVFIISRRSQAAVFSDSDI